MFQQFFPGTLREAEAREREVVVGNPTDYSALHQSMARSSGLQSTVLSLCSCLPPVRTPQPFAEGGRSFPPRKHKYFFFGKSKTITYSQYNTIHTYIHTENTHRILSYCLFPPKCQENGKKVYNTHFIFRD